MALNATNTAQTTAAIQYSTKRHKTGLTHTAQRQQCHAGPGPRTGSEFCNLTFVNLVGVTR